jgi:hypothetical protein
MGKKSTPKPPDLSGYTDALEKSGEWGFLAAQDQLKWAKEQDATNRALLERVLGPQLAAQQNQFDNAVKDRARYEGTYQPLEDNLIQDFQSYGTPERIAAERGRAMSDVATNFDAQRRNALQRLESYGVDPSQTRNAALDIGMRTQQAAAQAAAGTNATRIAEDKSRALRADAINIGRGMPSQVAQSYGQSVAAGATAQGGANQTSATSGGLMQGANSFMNTGQAGFTGAGNMANAGFNNQMTQYNAQQQANSSLYSGIGSAVGMAAMLADGGETPPGPIDEGPTDGSGIDDQVDAKLSVGEYVIPADVVQKKGVEFFDKLLEKYHTPAQEQRQQALQIPGRRAYA